MFLTVNELKRFFLAKILVVLIKPQDAMLNQIILLKSIQNW